MIQTQRCRSRILAAIPTLLSWLPFLASVYFALRYKVDVPCWDEWDITLPLVEKFYRGHLTFFDFWMQENNHRLFFPKLILLATILLGRWNATYLVMLNLVILLGIFLCLNRQLKITLKKLGGGKETWLTPVLSVLVFSLSQYNLLLFGDGALFSLSVLVTLIGIQLLLARPFEARHFFGALASGVVALYSHTNGVPYWLVGTFLLLIVPFESKAQWMKRLSIWSVCGFLCFAFYLYDYQTPEGYPPLDFAVRHPASYVKFVLSYLGATVSLPPTLYLSWVTGLLGIGIFIAACTVLLRHRGMKPDILFPFFSWAAYSMLDALLTGVGRAGFGPWRAFVPQYKLVAKLFWISNLALLYLIARGKGAEAKKGTWDFPRILSILGLVMITSISVYRSYSWIPWYERWHREKSAARAELYFMKDENLLRRLHPNVEVIKRGVSILRKYRLSVFR